MRVDVGARLVRRPIRRFLLAQQAFTPHSSFKFPNHGRNSLEKLMTDLNQSLIPLDLGLVDQIYDLWVKE